MPSSKPTPFLECPRCQATFLPNVVTPGVFTTCPKCFADFQLSEGRVAAPPQLEVSEWRTEEAMAAQATVDRHVRHTHLMLKVAVVIVILGGLACWKFGMGFRGHEKLEEASIATEQRTEIRAAFAVAQAALEAADWRAMSEQVIDAERVRPLMEWYYNQRPEGFTQRRIEGYDQELIDLQTSPPVATLRLKAVSPPATLHVVMQKDGESWKLDWESFSNVHGARWQSFITGQANFPETIEASVIIERCSESLLVPSFFTSSGLNHEDASRAVRVSHPSVEDSGVACFPEVSVVRERLWSLLPEAGKAQKVILRMRRLPGRSVPQGIVIEKVLQAGWTNVAAPERPPLEVR